MLLTLMAVFHGSGLKFVTASVVESNSEDFIKDIFPVLFLHTSMHLLGLAVFGLSTLWMREGHNTVLVIISSLIAVSAFAAFYLGALIPGILLLTAGFCFLIARYRS
ncbi:hypothetical protein [Poritiphilus flavus]|uniref:Uncharacterized protein n=1 Tax=Poritiphilus flavus TaxID=2697053 RepID=A0A6L9EGX7_9FLAO|nr:hypothetical protein [Poritiphilus flavus]NAS14037.1 hypothetical protein [Poritiphilus flavus]